MILLIHANSIMSIKKSHVFKFHYDSINSYKFPSIVNPYFYLNSIMILLIREMKNNANARLLNLNSIMILLIRFHLYLLLYFITLFKFHYDSINSDSYLAPFRVGYEFKFHYDSINSDTLLTNVLFPTTFKFHYDSINSKFLLVCLLHSAYI